MSLVRSSNGPLCPMSFQVPNTLHQLYVGLQNAQYEALEPFRDEDGELPEDLDRALAKVNERYSDNMRLYTVSDAGLAVGGGYVSASGAFWQCLICGFVLPATEREER
jgi:hypothetical protein